MGFTAPAIHYSALSTLPLDLSAAKSSHSTNIQSKINHLLTKFLSSDISHGQVIETKSPEIKESNPSPTIINENPNNNNSEHQVSTPTSVERLPFTEPYVSTTPKIEKRTFEFSSYHKHCTTRPQRLSSSVPANQETRSKFPARKTLVREIFSIAFFRSIHFDL